MPKWSAIRAEIAVRIEGIETVVLSGDENDVVGGARLRGARTQGHGRHVQGLRIHPAIDGIGKELAESGGIHVGRSEDSFVSVCAGTGNIVVLRDYVGLRGQVDGEAKQDAEKQRETGSTIEN